MTSLKVCFDRILPRDLRRLTQPGASGPFRMAVLKAKKWPNGSTLRIRFLGGDSSQHAAVQQFATEWTQYANLKLNFNNASDAEIRIAFQDDGAWSFIGTDCRDIPGDQPTMNFGWLDQGVVLHEFGHAIGLIHEHQNPLGGIKWNKKNVYDDLGGSPNFWDKATVDHNMFATYDRRQINGTELDEKSIMLYAIPARWTQDGFHSEPNEELSETDETFIGDKKNYPLAVPVGPVEIPIDSPTATRAEIGQAGEQDMFRFTISKPGNYTVETEGQTDVVMSVYGPASLTQPIAEDDDSGSGLNARIVSDLSPGIYHVQIRHYNFSGGTGVYGVRVRRSEIAAVAKKAMSAA